MDEPAAEENLKKFKRRIRKTPVLPIAAAFDQGIEKFKQTIREAVATRCRPQADRDSDRVPCGLGSALHSCLPAEFSTFAFPLPLAAITAPC